MCGKERSCPEFEHPYNMVRGAGRCEERQAGMIMLPKQRDKCRLGNEEHAVSCSQYVDPRRLLLMLIRQRHKPPCRMYACLCGNGVGMLCEVGALAH